MKAVVKKNRELGLINAQNTQNENRAETITLVVPEEYEDYNKKIVFILPNNTRVSDIITNNEYQITNAITQYEEVEFYIWLTKGNVDFRTKTKPLKFYHNENASNDITPEQIGLVNTVVNLLEEEIDKVENLDLDVEKIGTVATLTLTKKDGTTKEVEITDGTDGQDGYTPQKGVDYFTQEDIQEIENGVKTDLQETVLIDYSLIAETGSKIDLSINTTNYKLTAILKDKNNNIICTSNEIDLPLETMVVSASYDNTTKEIILTLQNETTVRFSVADLVSGLVSESQLQTILANYYTQIEINNLLANKVDKVAGKGLSTNDFTDEYKEQADTNTEDIEDIQEEQTEQNTEIGNLQAENKRIKSTFFTTTGTGQTITLNKTAELEFKKPPLPMGNSEQVQYSGKNIFNPSYLEAGNLSTTDGQEFAQTGYGRTTFIPVESSTTYCVTLFDTVNLRTSACHFFDENQEWISRVNNFANGTPFTTSTDCKYIRFTIATKGGGSYTDFDVATIAKASKVIQLELGSSTDYEPYIGGTASPNPDYPQEITNVTGDVEVVVKNKNLAWNGWAEDFVRRINYTPYAEITTLDNRNCLKYTANAGYNKYDTKYIFKTKFKENTQYTFMFDMFTDIHSGNICIEYTDGTVSRIQNLSTTAWNNAKMVSSPNKTIKYLRAAYESGYSWIDLDTFMVYEGTEQIDFIPRKEQKFIFPLGNEKLMLGDYLADDGIHHVREQRTFDGTENWQDTDSSSVGYSKKFLGIINEFKMRTEIICTHFKNLTTISDTNNSSIIGKAGISYWDNNYIYFGIEKQTTEEWKAYLAEQYQNGTPVIVEYELVEEQIVPYTSAQQRVYNAIKQALSCEGQTNISSNQNAIFNVEAYLDTKEVLDNKVDKVTGKGLSTNDFTNTYKNSVDSNTSARHTHTNKTVLDGIASSDITNWNGKQNETDNSLNTTNKTITGAINEVYSIAKGANQAVSYSNYQAMITAFNALANDVYNVGQNVMIVTLQVPDLWISGIESTSVPYTYTTDEAFTTALSTNGYVQVGYYKLSALETQKVDLTNYEQNTNKTTTISSSSTNAQYPSAKAVYDYIQSLDGDEVSY